MEDIRSKKVVHGSPNIIISNLPKEASAQSIRQFSESVGPVRKCFLVRDKEQVFTGMAYISFNSAEDAVKAVNDLNHCAFDGTIVNVKHSKAKKEKYEKDIKKIPVRTIKDQSNDYNSKDNRGYLKIMRSKIQNGRIVVRNINRGCTEDGLRKLFTFYGEILELIMLKLADGRPKGVAFVQYGSAQHASAAITKCNGSKFMGKTIAVDLAVPKDLYQSNESNSDVKLEQIDNEDIKDSMSSPIKKEKDYDNVNKQVSTEDHSGTTDFLSEKCSLDSDDEMETKEEELDELLNNKGKKFQQFVSPKVKFEHKAKSNDILEKRSLFIRSIAYDCDERTITKLLSKFGEVKHVLFCRDKLTQRFKGTAFAQFVSCEGSDACLEAFKDPAFKKDFIVNGRTIYITLAVGRDDIQSIKKESESRKKSKMEDKRNLYLAKEGLIKEGTRAADGLSKSDLALRKQRTILSKKILQNLHMFVSRTRLSVHNLDLTLSNDGLRKIFLKHSPMGADVTECRIMRNMYELDDRGKPRSKGYGFINFTKHEHALAALRQVNNNPDIFTPINRPIVEFSLENRAALNAKERRLQKSKEKNPVSREYKKIDNEEAPLEEGSEQKVVSQPYAGNQSHPEKKITRNQINNSLRRQFKGSKNKYVNKSKKSAGKGMKRKSKVSGGPPAKKKFKK